MINKKKLNPMVTELLNTKHFLCFLRNRTLKYQNTTLL